MAIGSISFEQEPVESNTPVITNWTPIVPYVVLQDDISGLFYFKLILEVRLESSTGLLLGKLKQRRNGLSTDIATNKARAIFDLRDMVNSQLEDTNADQNDTTKSIHTLGENSTTKVFSLNNNQLQKVYVKAYQEYSENSTDGPQEYLTPTVNDTKYYIAASLPLETARETQYFQGGSSTAPFRSYTGSFYTDKMLSSVERHKGRGENYASGNRFRNYVQSDDYHTIAFLNDNTNFQSNIKFIQVIFYDANDSSLSTTYVENVSANGGEIPTGTLTNAKRLLYYGCGPANLEAQTVTSDSNAKPSNNSGWAYYTIRGTSTSTPSVDDDLETSTYYFIKEDGNCKGYKIRRLAWRNGFGCFDYFNFKMKSTQTLDVSRDEYQTMLGNFNDTMYSYDNFGRGKKVRRTSAVLKETINTDWIKEEEAQLLETLIMSTNVQIVENADTDYTVPVMITDKSIIRKTSANDGVQIQYTFKIEYANPYNTNS